LRRGDGAESMMAGMGPFQCIREKGWVRSERRRKVAFLRDQRGSWDQEVVLFLGTMFFHSFRV
jgi:hypothetical protein